MSEYRYYRGGPNSSEAVEFDLINVRSKQYETTCVVDVQRLLWGMRTHPCGDGRDLEINDSHAVEILELIKRERDAVQFSGQVKTMDGWSNSGLNLDEYLAVGDEVDEAIVDNQRDCVPPQTMRAGYLQVGEPYADALDDRGDAGRWRPTYGTFRRDGSRWVYAGHCFAGQDVNRIPNKDVAGGMLRELKKKLGG